MPYSAGEREREGCGQEKERGIAREKETGDGECNQEPRALCRTKQINRIVKCDRQMWRLREQKSNRMGLDG